MSSPLPSPSPATASGANAWLEVADLTLSYGARAVVKGMGFTLGQGQIACLLGPSGCGKTTVLRALAGFEPLQTGRISLAGQLLSTPQHITPPEKRQIGMVFQDYALFPHLTVAQNVGFGLPRAGQRAARVKEMLDIVGLMQVAQRYPHELSGGQQQRVALARALAPQPSVLLLDEPFSNLDVALRERLATEVRSILKATQTTAVLVTHDQHEAFAMADVIGVMADGQLQQWDTAHNLFHAPHNRRVAEFVGEGSLLPAVVQSPHVLQLSLGAGSSELHSSEAVSYPPGTAVEVLLRPHDVQLDASSPLKGQVTQRAFRGSEFLYTLLLPGGQTVLASLSSDQDHATGDQIGLRLQPQHVVAFSA